MPSDYGSRHPGKGKIYSKLEAEQHGVETEEEDAEVIVAQMEEIMDAVTQE